LSNPDGPNVRRGERRHREQRLKTLGGFGKATRLQLVPSKWRTSPPPLPRWPAAQTSFAASAETPKRLSLVPLKAGLETTLPLLPSQCSTKSPEKPSKNPTAQTAFAAMAVTALNAPPRFCLGLETTLQLAPAHC